ncbi:MAG: EAL domain-containing protein [Sphingomonas sp.]|uniref:putative bifunctional diguanylate cyclase/phosphodiesterase n=1 Tax=Sphingomonas sp. TaxID=28214 RepID=UPI001B1F1245|nr:EAL domain-containing protein [Sphingomonas sp.]MBO9623770.1 EAL domain-containing protein [Sphingomonas sp.]
MAVLPLLGTAAFAIAFNAAERFERFAAAHEAWQLDELAFAAACSGLISLVLLVWSNYRLCRQLQLRQRAENEAQALALRDPLTSLPNRRAMAAAIDAARRDSPGASFSVLMIDLDRFKPINDTYGHEGGDAALRIVAARLEELAAGRGLAARMGGDEFACLIRHPEGSGAPHDMAQAILQAFAKPLQLTGGLAEVSASVGIVTASEDCESTDDMLRAADFAMYRAKKAGRSNCAIFVPEMADEMRRRAALELDIRAGLHRGEFTPFFQPIVALATGEVVGFEALARWRHPHNGMVGPDVFIPIAEDAGIIQELGFAMLRRACCEARGWPPHLTLSINISPLQLNDPWLAQRILQVLCATGFPAGRLVVEITESRLVSDIAAARAVMLSLKSAGVQIALDDFGTGYASLKHLRELAFNRIKIDRSFTENVRAPESAQIIRAILSLSEGLGLPVTAEGLESAESAEMLAGLGCDYGQGYLFSPPVDSARALEIARGVRYAAPRTTERRRPASAPAAKQPRYGT